MDVTFQQNGTMRTTKQHHCATGSMVLRRFAADTVILEINIFMRFEMQNKHVELIFSKMLKKNFLAYKIVQGNRVKKLFPIKLSVG